MALETFVEFFLYMYILGETSCAYTHRPNTVLEHISVKFIRGVRACATIN